MGLRIVCREELQEVRRKQQESESVQVRFQSMKEYLFGGLPLGNTAEKARASKHF